MIDWTQLRRCWQIRFVLPSLFLLTVPQALIMLAVMVPPGGVPDEPNHMVRADSLRYGEVFGHRFDVGTPENGYRTSGVAADPVLITLGYFLDRLTPAGKVTRESVDRAGAMGWTKNKQMIEAPNVAVYFPVLYMPSGLMLAAGRAAGVRPIDTILIARLLNALIYCAMGAVALAIARHARFLLLGLLSLPISLSLAASFNPDGLLIASVALAVALASRIVTGDMRVGSRGYWLEAILLLIVVATKPPYAPLALLLLIPDEAARDRFFAQPWPRLAACALVIVPALIWFAIGEIYVSAPLNHSPPYHPGPLSPDQDLVLAGANARLQARALLHSPLQALHLFVSWWTDNRWFDPLESIIGRIGTQDIIFSPALYVAWYVVMLAAALGDVFGSGRDRLRQAIVRSLLTGGGAFLSYAAVVLAIDLTWTYVGMPKLEGIQGRYLILMLMALALALPRLGIRDGRPFRGLAVGALALIALLDLIVLPAKVIARYYIP